MLKKALKQCQKEPKRKRAKCEKQAHKTYRVSTSKHRTK